MRCCLYMATFFQQELHVSIPEHFFKRNYMFQHRNIFSKGTTWWHFIIFPYWLDIFSKGTTCFNTGTFFQKELHVSTPEHFFKRNYMMTFYYISLLTWHFLYRFNVRLSLSRIFRISKSNSWQNIIYLNVSIFQVLPTSKREDA